MLSRSDRMSCPGRSGFHEVMPHRTMCHLKSLPYLFRQLPPCTARGQQTHLQQLSRGLGMTRHLDYDFSFPTCTKGRNAPS